MILCYNCLPLDEDAKVQADDVLTQSQEPETKSLLDKALDVIYHAILMVAMTFYPVSIAFRWNTDLL